MMERRTNRDAYLGGLSLAVVEVRRNSDDRFLDGVVQELGGIVGQFPKHLAKKAR